MRITISKRDTSILKGFAILCIVFHNYFHWLNPNPGENEFTFSASRVENFFQLLGDEPGEWFNLLFSYLGHYGVQIFVLISGFGLTVSMINRPRTWESFVLNRLKKLYPLLLSGILALFLGVILMDSQLVDNYIMMELKPKLLFIHTLIPNSGVSVNGPWWFFALILQLYLLFPLLFQWFKKWKWKAFVTVCVVSYGLIFLFRYGLTLYEGSIVMMNAPGHLPEFCLGMMLALQKDQKIGWGWLVLAIVIFCLGNVYALFYPFTFLAISVIALFAYQGLKHLPIKKQWLSHPLAYFGSISMTLFAVHVLFRNPVLTLAQNMQSSWGHFLSGLYFFMIVWAVAIAAKVFYDFLCHQLDKIHIRESRVTHIIGRVCQVALGLLFAYILGYFIAQNIHKHTQTVTDLQLVESGEVHNDAQFVSLFNQVADENMMLFDIQCSFDISSQDTLVPLPYLVLDIPKSFWMKFEIPASYNTSTPQHFEMSYRYLRPFNQLIKGKPIKLYFWAPNKRNSFTFENVQVTMIR